MGVVMEELDEIAIRRVDQVATLLYLRLDAIKENYRAQSDDWKMSEEGLRYRRWMSIITACILNLG
jgi:hypothetical protein